MVLEPYSSVMTRLDGMSESSEQHPEVPGYEILSELGRGGMGVVYLARQGSSGRLVALKMVLAGLHADRIVRERFRTEAVAVSRLRHPGIVQVLDVGECQGIPYLALEYLGGGNLLRKVVGVDRSEQDAVRLVAALARAVQYMHERGVLHRDLKPQNVLLTTEGAPKITDFGLARVLDVDDLPSFSEIMVGTPNYMAPEQASFGAEQVTASCDIYSLGAILYELLTTRAPFLGANPLKTLDQLRDCDPVPLRNLRRNTSPELETICMMCLEKQPSGRYSSAGALADDLDRFLRGQPILARPAGLWRRISWTARRESTRIDRALAAVATVLLLVIGWMYMFAIVGS